MIVCAAVIGPQNNPLFLRSYVPVDDEVKLQSMVHCSLDAVEEKVLLRRGPGEAQDMYLGLLYPTEEYRVYGYVTNSQAKFVLVLDEASPREDLLAKVFVAIHNLYVETTSNPFYTPGLPLTSRAFGERVGSLVTAYRQQAAGG